MKQERIIELIRHPEKSSDNDLDELYQLLYRYPYFQTIRILYLRTLYMQSGAQFRNELKTGTVHLTNHKHFFRFLNQQVTFENPPLVTLNDKKSEQTNSPKIIEKDEIISLVIPSSREEEIVEDRPIYTLTLDCQEEQEQEQEHEQEEREYTDDDDDIRARAR